jgi:hypothetical protein
MEKSILEFQKNGIPALEKVILRFFEDPTKIAEFVGDVQNNVLQFALNIIAEQFEAIDEKLRNSGRRKKNWEIVKRDEKTLTTSIGDLTFEKTLFRNKKTGEYRYLTDEILGLEKHERMTEDAEAKMYKEAAESSYRKAGEEMSILSGMSKQTVMNKLHSLQFPRYKNEGPKKVVKNLYIDADEDHIALQYLNEKGDIEEDKYANIPGKLVYVYEGVEPEAPMSERYRLIEPHYFSGVYEGKDNELLWDEVWEYIDSKYDIEKIEHIYLNSDGGNWIKGGSRKIQGIERVLDEFHISEYLTSMTTHLWDSKEDAKDMLRGVIRNGNRSDFRDLCKRIYDAAEEDDDGARKRVEDGQKYILNNWTPAKTRLQRRSGVVGSSTEGHVSHVLASRMSSRPMGWSKIGADKMAKLRAYSWNNGDMLELARYQKETLPKAAGAEEYLSLKELNVFIDNVGKDPNRYTERLQASLPFKARKQLCIIENIW